jgi:hypothetical protein
MGRDGYATGGWTPVPPGGWVRLRRRCRVTGGLVERVLAVATKRGEDTRLAFDSLRAYQAALGCKDEAGRARGASKTPATALLNAARVTKRLASTSGDLQAVERLLRAAASVEFDPALTTVNSADDECGLLTKVAANEATARRAAEIELAVFLCQEGRDAEASELLTRLGFRYRLARGVLRYPASLGGGVISRGIDNGKGEAWKKTQPRQTESASIDTKPAIAPTHVQPVTVPVRAYDGAVPSQTLARLQYVFAPDSSFWNEHGYHENDGGGFFSYAHDLERRGNDGSKKNDCRSLMDSVVRRVQAVAAHAFPAAKNATCAEWWAHSRPHTAGHQMHFDSDDEGLGLTIKHPICSAVVFVTGGVGGPTLVTDQKSGSKQLAKNGWLVAPETGRIAVFDGQCLHGVIPGRGVVAKDTAVKTWKRKSSSREQSPPTEPRRVTLMIAFWDTVEIRGSVTRSMSGSGKESVGSFPKGSARPFPDPEKFTSDPSLAKGISWPTKFRANGSDDRDGDLSWQNNEVPAAKTEAVWEDVDHERNAKCFPSLSVNDMRSLPAFDKCFMF